MLKELFNSSLGKVQSYAINEKTAHWASIRRHRAAPGPRRRRRPRRRGRRHHGAAAGGLRGLRGRATAGRLRHGGGAAEGAGGGALMSLEGKEKREFYGICSRFLVNFGEFLVNFGEFW